MPKALIFNLNDTKNIINLYKSGISTVKIAKQFNCSKHRIRKLLNNENIQLRNISDCQKKYKINESLFELINSHEKAYWLGMLTGDGCISKKGEISLSLQEKDKDYIYKFRDFLKSNHPIKKINNRNKKDGSPSVSWYLKFSNAKIIYDLKKYGLKPNKTIDMNFPKIPDEFISSYMLGLIDSDGCFCLKSKYNDKNIKLLNFGFIAPDQFAIDFQNILIKKCQISKTKLDKHLSTKFVAVVSYGGYKNIYKIVKFLYDKCPIFFHRKKNIAIDYLLCKFPNDEWLLKQKNIKSI